MSTLIVGCGYLGRRVGRILGGRGEGVLGTVRSEASAAGLVGWGIRPMLLDVLDPAPRPSLAGVRRVVYCVGFDRSAGVPMRRVYVDGLSAVLQTLPRSVEHLIYVSSTGVYGQDDGSWVDEGSPTEPRHESGLVCLEAERALRRARPGAVVLRMAGLYGPGRIVRRRAIERGEPIPGDPAKYLNVVRVEDAASAVVSALDLARPGSTYLVADDRPVDRGEYYALVARHLGAPTPRFVAPAPGSAEERREATNKRVSNRRIKADLGLSLAYPDVATGVPSALDVADAPPP